MRLVAILAAVVLIPACMQNTRPTLAQQDQSGSSMGTQGSTGQQQGSMQQGAQAVQLEGTVVSVDPNSGTLSIASKGSTIAVRGTPDQLQQYSEGQTVTLNYQNYGDSRWLSYEGQRGTGGAGGQGNVEQVSGTVSQIDTNQGVVTIGRSGPAPGAERGTAGHRRLRGL